MEISLTLNKLSEWLELGIRISDTARTMLTESFKLDETEETEDFIHAVSYEASKRTLTDLLSEDPNMEIEMDEQLANKIIGMLSRHIEEILKEIQAGR